eukprot:759750-Hanusia_phi.AAC.1
MSSMCSVARGYFLAGMIFNLLRSFTNSNISMLETMRAQSHIEESIGKLLCQFLQPDIVSLHSLDDLVVDVCQVADVVHLIPAVQ